MTHHTAINGIVMPYRVPCVLPSFRFVRSESLHLAVTHFVIPEEQISYSASCLLKFISQVCPRPLAFLCQWPKVWPFHTAQWRASSSLPAHIPARRTSCILIGTELPFIRIVLAGPSIALQSGGRKWIWIIQYLQGSTMLAPLQLFSEWSWLCGCPQHCLAVRSA